MTDSERIEKAHALAVELNAEVQRLAREGIEVRLYVRPLVTNLGGLPSNDCLDVDFTRPINRIAG